MNNYSRFGSFLASDINDSLKSIKFSDASTLDNSVANMSIATPGEESIDAVPDKIRAAVENYGELCEDRLHNGVYLDVYDEIANTFAAILHKGIENLKAVKKEVSEVENKINADITKFISQDPVLSEYDKKSADPEHLSMEGVDWSILDQVSERATIEKLHSSIHQNVDPVASYALAGMILNKLPNANDYVREGFNSIPLTQENRKRIVSTIHAEVKDKFKESEVSNLVDFVFDFNTNDSIVAYKSLSSFLDRASEPGVVNKILVIVDKYSNIISHFSKENIDLSNSTQAELDRHVAAIGKIVDASVYVCSYYRHTIWNKAVLIPGPFINPDTYDEFKAAGGKVSDVVQYNNRYYSNTAIPFKGIEGKDIISVMSNIQDKIKAEAVEHSKQCEQKKKMIHRDAFTANTYKWLNSKRDQFSSLFGSANDLDKYIANIYDGAKPSTSLESLLYTAVLNSCYINSIEKNIYNRISDAYAKHVEANHNLSKEDCDLINISVYSDMICEYLVNKGIVEA